MVSHFALVCWFVVGTSGSSAMLKSQACCRSVNPGLIDLRPCFIILLSVLVSGVIVCTLKYYTQSSLLVWNNFVNHISCSIPSKQFHVHIVTLLRYYVFATLFRGLPFLMSQRCRQTLWYVIFTQSQCYGNVVLYVVGPLYFTLC